MENYNPDVEKQDHAAGVNGGGQRYDLHHDTHDEESALERLRTAGSLSISPELFEKIYLSPKTQVSGNVRSTFGNPTPLALVGFLLCLTPLSNCLLNWQGSGGLGAAEVGAYYFFGGLLMIIGAIFEFVLGNTFPFVVFGSFGAFWLTVAATLTPWFNASAAYTSPAMFANSIAFFYLYMGLLCFIYFICSLRTNVIFMLIFALLVPSFGCLAGAYWRTAQGNPAAATLIKAAGGMTFVICMLGWYLLFVQLLASVDFPLNLPVGDLSRFIKGGSEKKKKAT